MKNYINDILTDLLKDEVNVSHEWVLLQKKMMNNSDGGKNNSRSSRKIFMSYLRYAAAVLLGVILSVSEMYIFKGEGSSSNLGYKLCTAKGEKTCLRLPDGTNVWLNSCTTIEYTAAYGSKNRNINLDGEAYFEVAKNKELPFVVKTSGGVDVTALGTAFNVSAYPEDSFLETTLYNGKVLVQSMLTKKEVILEPNQMAVFIKEKGSMTVSDVDSKDASWRSGEMAFDMKEMQEITKRLERTYNVSFRYKNQKIKSLKFTGKFQYEDGLQQILEVIKINTGVDFQKSDTVIVIK